MEWGGQRKLENNWKVCDQPKFGDLALRPGGRERDAAGTCHIAWSL